MRKLQLSTLLFFWFFIVSCAKNDDPVACFVIPERLEVNEEYKFKDCSINVLEHYWDFGDDEYAKIPNPVHVFKQEGTYTILLKGKGRKKTDELKRTITTWLNDISGPSAGIYDGEYLEYYADSLELNKEYKGKITVQPTTTKEIKVAFTRGSFRAAVVGDMDTGFVFTEVIDLEPARLALITSGKGSFSRKNKTFTFTLTGRDPSIDSLRWSINYSGVRL